MLRRFALVRHALAALLIFLALPALANSQTALWNRFYALQKTNPKAAESVLHQILKQTPNDLQAVKSMMYLHLNAGQKEKALADVQHARALAPNDESLTLQQAYLLNDLGQHEASAELFRSLLNSKNPETARTACEAVFNLGCTKIRVTKPPYFGDVYFSPSYESRVGAGVFPLKVRLGRRFGEHDQLETYGFLAYTQDTRSSAGAGAGRNSTEIVDDNAVILGGGVRYQPIQGLPIFGYAEAGLGQDLIDRGRAPLRDAITVGITGYQEWGDQPQFCRPCSFPMTPFGDLYGNLATYSRDQYNTYFQLRGRGGLNLINGPGGTLRGYLKLNTLLDTSGVFYNNLQEIGPGLSWRAPIPGHLSVSYEYMSAAYFKTPAPSGYSNHRFEITFYENF